VASGGRRAHEAISETGGRNHSKRDQQRVRGGAERQSRLTGPHHGRPLAGRVPQRCARRQASSRSS